MIFVTNDGIMKSVELIEEKDSSWVISTYGDKKVIEVPKSSEDHTVVEKASQAMDWASRFKK